MELGHLLARSGLTYPAVSSKVCHDSFCQLENSVSLLWVIYYKAFYWRIVSIVSCIPVICPKLVLFLIPLHFVYMFCFASHSCTTVSPGMEEMPPLNMSVQRLKAAVLRQDLPCSGSVTNSGELLSLHRALWNLYIVHSPIIAILLNLEKFNFTLEYTQLSLLHVSVFDHPQGPCTEPG